MSLNVPNTEPIFPDKVLEWNATLTTEVAPRVITTQTPKQLGTMGANGGFIHSIVLTPRGNCAATVFRLYKSMQENNATVYKLLLETTLPEITNASEAAGLASVNVTLPEVKTGGATQNKIDCPSDAVYFCALGTATNANTGYNVWVRGGMY
jgi:hypothetical protein